MSLDMPPDYKYLFNDSAKQKLVLEETYTIKGRNPISVFYYDNKYSLLVYKINAQLNLSLKDLIQQDVVGKNRSRPISYNELSFPNYKFSYAWDSVPIISKIIITIYGDSLSYFTNNKNISFCYLHLSSVFIRYKEDASWDIMLQKQNIITNNIPMEIVFYKMDYGLYILVVNNLHDSGPLDKKLPRILLDQGNSN